MTSSFDREKGNAARLDALLDEGRDENVHSSRPNDAYGNQPGDMSSQAPALNDLLNEIAGHIAKSEQDRSLSLEDMQAKLSEIAEHVRGNDAELRGDMSTQGEMATTRQGPQAAQSEAQECSLLGQIESHITTLANQMNEISTEDEQLRARKNIETQLAALTEHFAHSDMQFAQQDARQNTQSPNMSSDNPADQGDEEGDEGLISYKVIGEQSEEDRSADIMQELAPLAQSAAPHVNALQELPQKPANTSYMFESEEQANQALAQAYEEKDFTRDAFEQDKTFTLDAPLENSADVFADVKKKNFSSQPDTSQRVEKTLEKNNLTTNVPEEAPDAAALYSASVVSDEPEIPEALARALEARAAKAEAKHSLDFMSLKPQHSSSAELEPEPGPNEAFAESSVKSGLDNLVANFGQQLDTRSNLSGSSPAIATTESSTELAAAGSEQHTTNVRDKESGTHDNIAALEQKISQIAAHISNNQEHGKKIDKIEASLGALIERIETSELYLSKVASQAVDQAAGEFMNKLDARLQNFAPKTEVQDTDHAVLEAIQTTLSEMSQRLDRLEQNHQPQKQNETHSQSQNANLSAHLPGQLKAQAEQTERQAPSQHSIPSQYQVPILKQQPNFLAQQEGDQSQRLAAQHAVPAQSDEALSAHKNDFVRAARNAAALAAGKSNMNAPRDGGSPQEQASQNMAQKVKQAALKPTQKAQGLVSRLKKKFSALGPFRSLNVQPLLIGTAIIGMIIGGGYIANLMQGNLIEENGQNRSAQTIPPPPQGITPLPKMQRDDTNINAPLQGHRHRYGAHPPQTREDLKQSHNAAHAPMVNRVSKLNHNGVPQMTENAAKDKGKLPPGMAIGRASDPNIRRTLWSTARRRHIEKTLVGASKYHDMASPALGRVPVKISDQPASVQKRHIAKIGQSISGKKYISSTSDHKTNQYVKIAKYRPNSARFAVAKVGQRTQAVSKTRPNIALQKRAPVQQVKPKSKRLDKASLSVASPKDVRADKTVRRQTLQMPPLAVGPNSLRLAAAQGHASAQFEVANRLMSARSGQRDYRQAMQWYKRAAAQSHAPAQYRLGAIYERGKGVKRDLSRARAWYRRAAQLGNIKAMHNLAVLYTGRSGLAPDYATAAQWFLEAAKYGLADSQYNLGILLKNGLGVKKDFSQAYKWFTLAAIQGDKPSLKQRKLITQNITPEEIARLDESTLNWHAEPEIVAANDTSPPRGGWQKIAGQPQRQSHVSNAAQSADVTQTQYLLQKLGYNVGSINGQLNDKTRKAIMQFEQRSGLVATGQVSKALLVQLKALAS